MKKRASRVAARASLSALVCALILAGTSLPAQAHVKWFSKVANCLQAPLPSLAVMGTATFLILHAATTATMMLVFWVERRLAPWVAAREAQGAWNATTARIASHVLRLAISAYFSLLPLVPGSEHMVLTPELLSGAAWVPAVQFTISLCVLWRRTEAVAALGIVILFGFAASEYGWYHMVDYVYCLGLAVFLLADALPGKLGPPVGLGTLRICTGVSLLWVSVEKWAYPAWAYDVLTHQLSGLTMGLELPFFVTAAGFVEFCLAFLLLLGRLSSQVAALMLLILMAAAIPLAGPLDGLGHAPLLIVLGIFVCSPNPMGYRAGPSPRRADSRPIVSFAMSVPGLVGMYDFAHVVAYPTRSDGFSLNAAVAAVLTALLLSRVFAALPQMMRALSGKHRLAAIEAGFESVLAGS